MIMAELKSKILLEENESQHTGVLQRMQYMSKKKNFEFQQIQLPYPKSHSFPPLSINFYGFYSQSTLV